MSSAESKVYSLSVLEQALSDNNLTYRTKMPSFDSEKAYAAQEEVFVRSSTQLMYYLSAD